MHRTTAFLLWLALAMPLAGAAYFCGLLADVQFGWIIGVAVCLVAGSGLWMAKLAAADSATQLSRRMQVLLLAGIGCLAVACAFLSRRYGDWDAALIWNLHARHLAGGDGWRAIFEAGASGNAAYPLGLPSTIAVAWRVLDTQSQMVPFVIALLPTLGIPVAIFLEGAGKKFWTGVAVLALFGLHRYYLALGLDQYADIQVAWLWLMAAVCMNRAEMSTRRDYWVVVGLLLGALCWTKWEGVLLTICLLAAHLRCLLQRPCAVVMILLGAAPFLLVTMLFLQTGPPSAPLLADLSGVITRGGDGHRYRMIAAAFVGEAVGRHWPLALLLIATPLVWRGRMDSKARRLYTAVITAIAGYAAVYLLLVFTDLDWNLQFSLPRLLLQVYPLAAFAAASAASSKGRQTLQ